jgi:L-ribulose-5-phosphate 3-epimerase
MNMAIDRRRFLISSGVMLAAAPALGAPKPAERIKKAVGWEMILEKNLSPEDKLRLAKDVGYEGVEINTQAHQKKNAVDPQVLARASQKVGLPIHGVSNGGHPDLKTAIDEAAIYGATTVLHVVRTDPTGSFMENYRRSQAALREAVPHAEKKRIRILVENVWATFLIEPLSMARYVDELASPWVQAYFDVGNCMRWGYPQHWIEVLGKRIGKIHIKEFSLQVAMKSGMIKAFDFPIGQGDIDWKRVRSELAKVGFHGWATAEVPGGDRKRLAEISAQMDRVLYGQDRA